MRCIDFEEGLHLAKKKQGGVDPETWEWKFSVWSTTVTEKSFFSCDSIFWVCELSWEKLTESRWKFPHSTFLSYINLFFSPKRSSRRTDECWGNAVEQINMGWEAPLQDKNLRFKNTCFKVKSRNKIISFLWRQTHTSIAEFDNHSSNVIVRVF